MFTKMDQKNWSLTARRWQQQFGASIWDLWYKASRIKLIFYYVLVQSPIFKLKDAIHRSSKNGGKYRLM